MAQHDEHTANHPTFKQYVAIAISLFAITIVEFGLIWDRIGIEDDLGATKIPLLVGLSAIKFAVVIMFYMHLKFDNRLFGTLFISGLALAFTIGIALLGIFVAFDGGQRTFAQGIAVPYVEHAETTKEVETAAPATSETLAAGPVAIAIAAVGDSLSFNTDNMTADSGAEVTVTFNNPSTVNTHNFVVVRAGTKDSVATAGLAAGQDNDWVQPGDSNVVANTVLIGPGESTQVTFTAPAPGAYQFVCTFPGHNFTMFGEFVVN